MIQEKTTDPESRCSQTMNNFELRNIPLMTTKIIELNKSDYEINISVMVKTVANTSVKIKSSSARRHLILESVLSQLESLTNRAGIYAVKISREDPIFTKFQIVEFAESAEKYLQKLKIKIMQPIRAIAADERQSILEHYHNHHLEGGHAGTRRMNAKLRSLFRWKGMSKDIINYIKRCDKCRLNKPKFKNVEPLVLVDTPASVFESVVIDTIGPFMLSENGNRYGLTLICELSKYLVVIPIPNKDSSSVAKALVNEFVLKYGPMKRVRTDMGTEFCNRLFAEVGELLKLSHFKSTAYHHETVGIVERNHRTFNEYLRSYSEGRDTYWDEYLKAFAFCYNTTPNTTIGDYTPFEVVFGRRCGQLREIAANCNIETMNYNYEDYVTLLKHRLSYAQNKANEFVSRYKLETKRIFDKKSKPIKVSLGDKVLLRKEVRNKFDSLYKDGFEVVEVDNYPNITIKEIQTGKTLVVHRNRISI